MKKITYLLFPSVLLAAFIVWTALVKVVDIQYIGPAGFLGFYHLNTQINDFVQALNTSDYALITNILMFGAIATVLPFAIIGIVQLVKRKDLKKVDPIIYVILASYIAMAVIYLTFEIVKINYSPLSNVNPDDGLKASYPSSHVLVTIVMLGAAVMGLLHYVKMSKLLKVLVNIVFIIIAFLAAFFRLYSGQHYFTDIIGGLLISFTILAATNSLKRYIEQDKEEVKEDNE